MKQALIALMLTASVIIGGTVIRAQTEVRDNESSFELMQIHQELRTVNDNLEKLHSDLQRIASNQQR